MPEITEEFIEEYSSLVTETICEMHGVDYNDKRACAILAWQLSNSTLNVNDNINDTYKLSLQKSLQVSLESLRLKKAGLSAHRKSMLSRVPKSGQFASFKLESIEIIDLAYLSAYTGHEFALIRGKVSDILVHGTNMTCNFSEDLLDGFMSGRFKLIAHSHPDIKIVPSINDRIFLRRIGQESSMIVSWYTGKTKMYTGNSFE